jgi:UDP-N-acetylglucosamine:LPS N-acetylglucosamine transferase
MGEGGHSAELFKLIEYLGDRYKYSYVIIKGDHVTARKIKDCYKIYEIKRPRDKIDNLFFAGIKTFMILIKSFSIITRLRPFAIISSGPGIAVPICIAGKIFFSKIIFIETGSRVTRLSTTGKVLYRFADLFFIQWPELKKKYSKAIYAGRLL